MNFKRRHAVLLIGLALLAGALIVPLTLARRSPRPVMEAVELRYAIYLAGIETHTTVTPDGLLRSVRTRNKSYGRNDRTIERTEVRAGRLTAEQRAELLRLVAGWQSLSNQPYGSAPDDAEVTLRYGNKVVTGGSGLPKQVWDVYRSLEKISMGMPIISAPSAATAGSQPALAPPRP